jgi:hypothetical protein
MHCQSLKLPGGAHAIVCTSGSSPRPRACSVCKRKTPRYKLCDYVMWREGHPGDASKTKTCDAVLCSACASHRDLDIDYCPLHAQAVDGRLRL